MNADQRLTLGLVAFIFGVMVFTGPLLQAYDDSTERTARAKRDAEVRAMVDHRVDRAARAVCAEQYGPGAVAVWVEDSTLQCYPSLSAPVALGGRP